MLRDGLASHSSRRWAAEAPVPPFLETVLTEGFKAGKRPLSVTLSEATGPASRSRPAQQCLAPQTQAHAEGAAAVPGRGQDAGGAAPGCFPPHVVSTNVCDEHPQSVRPPHPGTWTQPCAGPAWQGGTSHGLCSASVGDLGLFL